MEFGAVEVGDFGGLPAGREVDAVLELVEELEVG